MVNGWHRREELAAGGPRQDCLRLRVRGGVAIADTLKDGAVGSENWRKGDHLPEPAPSKGKDAKEGATGQATCNAALGKVTLSIVGSQIGPHNAGGTGTQNGLLGLWLVVFTGNFIIFTNVLRFQ